MRALLGAAFSIGLMGSVEAIAIGKTLAARAGHSFDASRQLLGEGFCNLGAALVGGFASSGSFSRTAVNFEAGAITRLSCVLSGVLAAVIVLAFAPAANLIPIAALAGTLVHIGLKLVDVGRLRVMFGTTTGDRSVLLLTFAAVLFVEHLENALFIGIAASFYYALRRAEGFKLRVLTFGEDGSLRELPERDLSRADEVTVLNLQGELFFAAAEELQAELMRVLDTTRARFIVLRVQEAYNVDATTGAVLSHVADEARRRGGRLLLCGVRPGMYGTLERAGLLAKLGTDAVFPAEREVLASTRHAVLHAQQLASGEILKETV
jgi:SulP family sulfate permease